jgi:benzoate-CoA ligase
MLKVAGKWVAPVEIEGRLLEHEVVKEAAVIGAEDSTGLIKAHAFCTVVGSEKGLEQTLKDWVLSGLEPHKTPRKIIFLKSLPRTHLGKVDRGALKKIASRSSQRKRRVRRKRQPPEKAS